MSFDRIAPIYELLETVAFGRQLERARTAMLSFVGDSRRVLIAGEGNGRFLYALVRANENLEIACLDQSRAMLELARGRVAKLSAREHISFHQCDVRRWRAENRGYDLIVTHFFLDCFRENELGEVIGRIAGAATSSAQWLIADFALPEGGLARLHARAWLRLMYAFFGLTCGLAARRLPDHAPFMRQAGFVLIRQAEARFGLIRSQLWRRS